MPQLNWTIRNDSNKNHYAVVQFVESDWNRERNGAKWKQKIKIVLSLNLSMCRKQNLEYKNAQINHIGECTQKKIIFKLTTIYIIMFVNRIIANAKQTEWKNKNSMKTIAAPI